MRFDKFINLPNFTVLLLGLLGPNKELWDLLQKVEKLQRVHRHHCQCEVSYNNKDSHWSGEVMTQIGEGMAQTGEGIDQTAWLTFQTPSCSALNASLAQLSPNPSLFCSDETNLI